MGKLTYFVHQSIDGFIEGPNGEFDWPLMGPELGEYSRGLTDTADVFLYGRVVWEMMSDYWPKAEEISDDEHDLKFAPVWRAKPKVVVSTTIETTDWHTTVVKSPAALNETSGNLILFGGSALAASLTEQGLIDDYQIFVHPVVLGGGKPVFPAPSERINDLRLVESKIFDGKVVLLRYNR